jgi:hypothetical protein
MTRAPSAVAIWEVLSVEESATIISPLIALPVKTYCILRIHSPIVHSSSSAGRTTETSGTDSFWGGGSIVNPWEFYGMYEHNGHLPSINPWENSMDEYRLGIRIFM